jgi:hypothetical protein
LYAFLDSSTRAMRPSTASSFIRPFE